MSGIVPDNHKNDAEFDTSDGLKVIPESSEFADHTDSNSLSTLSPSVLISPASLNGATSSVSNPEWVNMEFSDIGKSVFIKYPLSKDRKDLKISSIKTALSLNDIGLLTNLSVSREGLLNNELRSQVWPIFLGITNIDNEAQLKKIDLNDFKPHKDENQVSLDINRSFSSYPRDRSQLSVLRSKLETLIVSVLRKYPKLSYYQGYHDIAQVILLVFNGDVYKSFVVLEKLTLMHLRDFMMPSIDSSIVHLNLIKLIMFYKDFNFFKILNNLPPYYALSSIITLFTHDIADYNDISYVFDFLLSSAANNGSVVFSAIYLYSEIMLTNKSSILNLIFENIYSKINSNEASYTNSYVSENDTLADSLHSSNTNISDSVTNVGDDEDSYTKERGNDQFGFASMTESQFRKTSSLSNSDFFGYDDADIELINFDYLHNILTNLVGDFTLKIRSANSKFSLFDIFDGATSLMKTIPVFQQVEKIEESKTFENDESKEKLIISMSKYSVLKNTSKFVTSDSASEKDNLCDFFKMPEDDVSYALILDLTDKQVEECLELVKKQKEKQAREFEELLKRKKASKKRTQITKTPCYRLILYPLIASNSKIINFFQSHKLIKISVIIGVVSIILNVYMTNKGFRFQLHSLYNNSTHNDVLSFGHSSFVGLYSVIQTNGHLLNSHVNNIVDELTSKFFS